MTNNNKYLKINYIFCKIIKAYEVSTGHNILLRYSSLNNRIMFKVEIQRIDLNTYKLSLTFDISINFNTPIQYKHLNKEASLNDLNVRYD